MRIRFILFLLISLLVPSAAVYCLFDKTHDFDAADCTLCHLDSTNQPKRLKPIYSFVCLGCHAGVKDTLSHPYDMSPVHFLPPDDMPLVDGNISCITCHFVHPDSKRQKGGHFSLLRKKGKGAAFCNACHRIDETGHIVFERAHKGSYKTIDKLGTLDRTSLQCIECHIDQLPRTLQNIGTGAWVHESRFIHPVGISYTARSLREKKQLRPAAGINKALRLYDGKIGCGTCHSPYSKRKNMLVLDNQGSNLCKQCHIK